MFRAGVKKSVAHSGRATKTWDARTGFPDT